MAGPIKSVSKQDHLEPGRGTSKPAMALSKKAAAERAVKGKLTGDWRMKGKHRLGA